METLLAPLAEQFFLKALLGGSLIATVCSVVGCFIVLRRMAFLGDALAHSMLAGVTAGYLIMHVLFGARAHSLAMLVGAVLAALITVGMINFVSSISRVKEDTAIGIAYTGIFALGGLLASAFSHRIHLDLLHFIMGDILGISDDDLRVAAWVAAGVLSAIILFYRQLKACTFDPIMAAAIGIPVTLFNYLLTVCTSLVVVSGVTMVGVILVVGMLITPAASAYLLCTRLSHMLLLSACFGVSSVWIGLYLAIWLNVSGAAPIILAATGQFLICLFVAPRHGLIARWWQQWRQVPQVLREDILGYILKTMGDDSARVLTFEELFRQAHLREAAAGFPVSRALSLLVGEGLLERQEGGVRLTSLGRREALRLRRAHRLWETYLQHVGQPVEKLHDAAHRLEHVHDPAAIEYLDDKLGHPLTDPHGSEIPADETHRQAGSVVLLSSLREGQYGAVEAIDRQVVTGPGSERLHLGQQIVIGPRQQDGQAWTAHLADGHQVVLDHAAADGVKVMVLEEQEPVRPQADPATASADTNAEAHPTPPPPAIDRKTE